MSAIPEGVLASDLVPLLPTQQPTSLPQPKPTAKSLAGTGAQPQWFFVAESASVAVPAAGN